MFESHIKKNLWHLVVCCELAAAVSIKSICVCLYFRLETQNVCRDFGIRLSRNSFHTSFFPFLYFHFFLFPRDPCITAFFGYLCLVEGPLAAICECLFHLFILCDQNPGSGGHFIHARKVGKRCQLNSLIHN